MEEKFACEREIEIKLKEHEDGIITFEQVQDIANKAINIKFKAEVSLQDYKHEIEHHNNLLSESDTRYKPILSSIQHQEERRINFVKYMMEKLVSHFSECHTLWLTREDKYNDSVKMISHFTDLQIFIDENRSRASEISTFDNLKVQLYEQHRPMYGPNGSELQKQNSESEDFVNLNLPSQEEIENSIQYVKTKIRDMIRSQIELTMEDKAELLNMLHNKEVNFRVTEELKTITDVKEYHVLRDLSDLVNYMITESINDKHNDFKIINNILGSSGSIYCRKTPDGQSQIKKTYLMDMIKNHAIWGEINRWKTWIYWVIEEKKKESLNKKKKHIMDKFRKLKAESNEDDVNKSMFGYFLSKVTKPLAAFELDNEQRLEIEAAEQDSNDNRTNLNIIFNVLSSYLHYFSQFGVKLETSKNIMLYFCERYELDKDRTQLLLSELESNYTKEGFTPEEQLRINREKKKKLDESFENNKTVIAIYHVMKYLSDDETLIKILRLSKTTYRLLKPTVYRWSLLNVRYSVNHSKREYLWNYFLNLSEIICDYTALRDRINMNPAIIERVEEVITLDVQRSFNNTESISRENLSNILKTYAFYNPEIEYCQGMNFLAGFFYFYYRDEERAFKAMLGLIKKFDLTELFNTTLPRLKLYFYILDRLISMHLPELHSHFKNEYITSSLFSSAWFITWFWNTITHQKTADLSDNILLFWDNFIIDGYLVIFQVAIILLGIFEEKLMGQTFEEMLNYITDIPKILFSKNEIIENLLESDIVPENEEESKVANEGEDEEIILFEQSPHKKTDIVEMLKDVDFPSLLKNSNITIELLDKLEMEYKDNEAKGSFGDF